MEPARYSRRWLVMALLSLATLISYMDRGNLSIAAPVLMREFGFTPARMGVLLSSFFWTYALFQIPAGFIVDRFGIRTSLAVGLFLWSIAAASMGAATGFWQMVALRMALGFGEAIGPVASVAFIKRNFDEHEQGLPTAIYVGGALAGPGLGTLVGGALIDPLGWRMLFVVVGLLGCLWLIPWAFWAPPHQPVVRGAEAGQQRRVPWASAIANPVFWAITLGAFFYSYYWYFILAWVPTYLVNVRGFSNLAMGATLGLPLAGTALTSLASGALADRIIRKRGAALEVRKTFVTIGFLLGTTIVALTTLRSAGEIPYLFVLSMCGMGIGVSNYWALTHLVSPAHLIGRVLGYQNMIAQLAGVAAPIVTGWLIGAENRFTAAIVVAGMSPILAAAVILLLLRRHSIVRLRDTVLL